MKPHNCSVYCPKDFILTPEGLLFAVVAAGLEEHRVLCFLRYQHTPTGWQKLNTDQANTLLASHYPEYLFYSSLRDTPCHAVPLTRISQHLQPQQRVQQLLASPQTDPILQTCTALLRLLQANGIDVNMIGITGSLLIGAQHAASDIDLVFYDRAAFQQCRQLVPHLIAQQHTQALTHADWQAAYQRRDCDLNFADYVWHEQRKANKALFNGVKIDFSFINCAEPLPQMPYKKAGAVIRQLQVCDDHLAYDHPAEFGVTATDIDRVLCFTATYTGQAVTGEWIAVSGQLEVAADGSARIVVGASREAKNEYIKVINAHA